MVLLRFMAFRPSGDGGAGGGGGGGAPARAQPAPGARPASSGGPAAGVSFAGPGPGPAAGAPAASRPNPAPQASAAPAAAMPAAHAPTPATEPRAAAPAAAPAPAESPAQPQAAAPLVRPVAPRAVAAATSVDDDPPWGEEEPDVYEDDLPAPTRSRLAPEGGGRVAAPTGRSAFDEDVDAAAEPSAPQRADRTVAAPPPLPPFERTALGTQWAELVAQWNGANLLVALVRELAMQAELVASGTAGETTEWRLRVARETLRNPALVEKLTNIARQQLGRDVRIAVEAGEAQDSPAKREAYEADRRQRTAIEDIQSDPTVRALLDQFRTARILPGSIKPL
jgi:DNA polymerase-3 subunit gamma/tau